MARKSIYEFGETDRSDTGRAKGAIINNRLRIPILKELHNLGNDYQDNEDISKLLVDKIALNEADLSKVGTGTEFDYRMKWALNHLKNGGLVDKNKNKQTSWKINDEGIQYLSKYDLIDSDLIEEDKLIEANRNIQVSSLKTRYWALGFNSNYERLKKFKNENYWQALDYEDSDNSNAAKRARKLFSQISVGHQIIIKGYGGAHDLNVHYQGEVIEIDAASKKIYLDKIDDVKYKRKAPSGKGAGNWHETILEVKRQNDIESLFYRNEEENNNYLSEPELSLEGKPKLPIALNTILYGPPGTGKTYQTITEALKIVSPNFYAQNKNNREALIREYERLFINNWSDSEGQIVFCTFHQSFSYEDFVEGIKPEIIDEKDIIYTVQKGIFRFLCDRARTASDTSAGFDSVISRLKNDILENGIITLRTDRGNQFDVNYTGQSTFRIRPHESTVDNPQYPAAIENIRMLYEGAPLTALYNPSYVKGILEHLYKAYGLIKFSSEMLTKKPYVIIIDEINRGNVSAIFGELITLLEADKRAGASEALSLMLPYSKMEFSVPKNVYLIGTMNTADRSVEALDTALRRRFSFKEIMPDPSLLQEIVFDGFNLEEVLKTINERIEFLLDRDHTIGHSYFMKLKSHDMKGLEGAFRNKIIPLLQEYFYHDYEKIALILGPGFVDVKSNHEVRFPDLKGIDKPDNTTQFKLKNKFDDVEGEENIGIENAILQLLASDEQ